MAHNKPTNQSIMDIMIEIYVDASRKYDKGWKMGKKALDSEQWTSKVTT